jgi:opacity protein-like surface antigen
MGLSDFRERKKYLFFLLTRADTYPSDLHSINRSRQHALEKLVLLSFRGQRRDIRSSLEIALKQRCTRPIVRSVVVLGLFSASMNRHATAQTPRVEDAVSSSTSTASALLPSAATSSSLPDAPRRRVETSISLGGTPQLSATRLENIPNGGFLTQSLHPSAGVEISFRQSFRPWLGYSVNMGYTRAAEHNTNNAGLGLVGTYGNFYVPNNVWELSLSHIAQTHLNRRLTAFTEEGAGFMAFQPAKRGSTYTVPTGLLCCVVVGTSFRPLIVFGVGAEYRLTPQLSLRGEYRGLLYKFPDYGLSIPKLITISSQPTVSLTYRFGGKHHFKQ